VNHILDELEQDQRQLISESGAVYRTLVKPTFDAGGHHYYMTLWAYVMSAFARVDLYSRLTLGERPRQQTTRMLDFLNEYLPREELAHRLAVQLWRHALMHTARPRQLRDTKSGREYYYLLHWGAEQLPREQHYTIQQGKNLALGLDFLLEDLLAVVLRMRTRAEGDPLLRARLLAEWPNVAVQAF
jgi:hypothetical protein